MARNKFDVDETLNKKAGFSHFKKLGKYMKKHVSKIVFAIVIMFVCAFLELLPPYFTSVVIDKCLPQSNYKLLFIIAVILIAAQFIVLYIQKKKAAIIHRVGQEIIHDIRFDLFTHMQHLPFSYFDSRPHGKISVRVVNYINSIAGLLSDGIVDICTNLFTLFVIIGFMFAMDVQFTLICLAGMPVFICVLLILKTHHRKAWQKLSAKQSNLNAYIHESISGMKVTQSFARENKNFEIFDGLCAENKKYWMRAKFIEMGIPAFVNVLSVVTVILVYALGANRILTQGFMVGSLIAFASYISRFWTPITQLTTFYNSIVNCAAYIERIFETMEEPLIVEDLPDAKELPEIKGQISFKNVTFAYDENEPNVLEDVSFDVKPGMSIALVGPTGAGKSTIINLLSRFYDIQGGQICIDGHDIKHVTLPSLRKQMGIMLQDSFLFSGTIMDNIRYSKLDATDDEIIAAAKTVCAHDFIMQFPDGYNTVVTERGASLSSGQRQLIAFARALLANPAILILDEATSSIDTETEMALQQGLEALLKGRTSFIVAHRLSTIRNSSKIMYIKDKNIAESGTHTELIEKHGNYYDLYQAQYKFLETL